MPSYRAPQREYSFLLRDVLDVEAHRALPGFSDFPLDLSEQIIAEGAKLTEEVIAPLNAVGDREGCVRGADGSVATPAGFKEAYAQLVAGGWPGLACDPAFGGQGAPRVLSLIFNEMVSSANMAFGMYPGLSHGAYEAIAHHGSAEQKALYLPRLASGEWTGTMNLTEPHAGTDLGLLRTRAAPAADGSYKITGQKIFISAGEHDLAANIVHLVLARIDGAPAGTRGISLFITPKFLPNEKGEPGVRNALSCGKLEEKMGIHGNATCVMNYDGATGWLIGEENRGLAAMFTMMNEARLGVGLQGLAIAEIAYQNAVAYAKDRLQGRSLTGPKNPAGPADPLIVLPDVRRMLMDAKCFIEGARAFTLWTALHGDLLYASPDAAVREKAGDYMGLMTPILKSYLTEMGYATATDCQQVYGGHGFIEEWGMSQFVRDARITMIYEGANGVQALDLVGRKLAAQGGRALQTFLAELDAYLTAQRGAEGMGEAVSGLAAAKAALEEATAWLMANALSNPDHAGAGGHDFLKLFALTALAYMWARQTEAALRLQARGEDGAFAAAKLTTARYFFERRLPDVAAHLARLKAGAEAVMALPAEAF